MPNIVSVMMAQILRWLGQVGKMNRDKIPRIFLLRKIVGRKKNGILRGHWKRQEALDKNSTQSQGPSWHENNLSKPMVFKSLCEASI